MNLAKISLRKFALLILVSAVALQTEHAHAQCYSVGLVPGDPICMGYAMARAAGYDNPTGYNAFNIYPQYFSFNQTANFQVGDIIVFGPSNVPYDQITSNNGHATYVSAILSSTNPGERLRLGTTGVWQPTNIPNPANDDNVICDQVSYGGGPEELGVPNVDGSVEQLLDSGLKDEQAALASGPPVVSVGVAGAGLEPATFGL